MQRPRDHEHLINCYRKVLDRRERLGRVKMEEGYIGDEPLVVEKQLTTNECQSKLGTGQFSYDCGVNC